MALYGLQGHAKSAQDRVSHEGQPAQDGAGMARALGGDGHLWADPAGLGEPSPVDPSRRAAVRERPHPHGHRAEQDPQGSRREIALDARQQRGVRARVGLPRAADRASGGQGARSRPGERGRAPGDGSHGEAPPLPRVRGQVHRHPARGVPAPGRVRRLERSLPDDGARLPGGDRARVRPLRRPRPGAQGAQARALVHALQDRARPGRGGVRGPDHAVGLREVPGQDGARARSPARSAAGRSRS